MDRECDAETRISPFKPSRGLNEFAPHRTTSASAVKCVLLGPAIRVPCAAIAQGRGQEVLHRAVLRKCSTSSIIQIPRDRLASHLRSLLPSTMYARTSISKTALASHRPTMQMKACFVGASAWRHMDFGASCIRHQADREAVEDHAFDEIPGCCGLHIQL